MLESQDKYQRTKRAMINFLQHKVPTCTKPWIRPWCVACKEEMGMEPHSGFHDTKITLIFPISGLNSKITTSAPV